MNRPNARRAGLKDTRGRRSGAAEGVTVRSQPPPRVPRRPAARPPRSGHPAARVAAAAMRPQLTCRPSRRRAEPRRPPARSASPGCPRPQRSRAVALATGAAYSRGSRYGGSEGTGGLAGPSAAGRRGSGWAAGPSAARDQRGGRLAGIWPPGKREEGNAGERGAARAAESLSLRPACASISLPATCDADR